MELAKSDPHSVLVSYPLFFFKQICFRLPCPPLAMMSQFTGDSWQLFLVTTTSSDSQIYCLVVVDGETKAGVRPVLEDPLV